MIYRLRKKNCAPKFMRPFLKHDLIVLDEVGFIPFTTESACLQIPLWKSAKIEEYSGNGDGTFMSSEQTRRELHDERRTRQTSGSAAT